MICRCGKSGFRSVLELEAHWKAEGCNRHRKVWKRVLRARKNGTKGRRILHRAFPELYRVRPMPEEVKNRLRQEP